MSRTYKIESRLVDIIESLYTTASLYTHLIPTLQLFPLVAVPPTAVTTINDLTTLHRSLHSVFYPGQRHAPSITQAIGVVCQVNNTDIQFDTFDKLVSDIIPQLLTAPHKAFANIHHIIKYNIRNISIKHAIDILRDPNCPRTIDLHRGLINVLYDLTVSNLSLCQYLKSDLGLLTRTQYTFVEMLSNSIKLQDVLFQYLLYLYLSETQSQSIVNTASAGYLQSPAVYHSTNDLQVCAISLEYKFIDIKQDSGDLVLGNNR